MSTPQIMKGQCLCGAVTVEASAASLSLSACNCSMCRQHTSSVFIALQADPETVKVAGPATSFQSSEWAERGFCSTCGSTLWYGTVHDGARYLAAGLFENAADAVLELEYFADKCPSGYRLEGNHKRLSEAETIAFFTSDDEAGA